MLRKRERPSENCYSIVSKSDEQSISMPSKLEIPISRRMDEYLDKIDVDRMITKNHKE